MAVIQNLLGLGIGGAFIEQRCDLRLRESGIEQLGKHVTGERSFAGGAALRFVKDERVRNFRQMHGEHLSGINAQLAHAGESENGVLAFTGAEQFGDRIAVGKWLAGFARELDQFEAIGIGKAGLLHFGELQDFVLRWIERAKLIGIREWNRGLVDRRGLGGLEAFAAAARDGRGERAGQNRGTEPATSGRRKEGGDHRIKLCKRVRRRTRRKFS